MSESERREADISLIFGAGFVLEGNPFDVAGIFDSYEVIDFLQDSFNASEDFVS